MYYLILAIIFEVIGTSCLKATEEFTKLVPTVAVVFAYAVAIYFLTLSLKHMPIGIAYAIWSGMGIVLIVGVAAIVYKQIPDLAAIIGMLMIIGGVVIIHLWSKTAH